MGVRPWEAHLYSREQEWRERAEKAEAEVERLRAIVCAQHGIKFTYYGGCKCDDCKALRALTKPEGECADAPERTPRVVELNAPSWVNAAADDAVLEWVAIPKEDLAALEQDKREWCDLYQKAEAERQRLRAAIKEAASWLDPNTADILRRALTKPEGE